MSNNLPSLEEINKWIIIGMGPSDDGDAVNVNSSNELGADQQVLSSADPNLESVLIMPNRWVSGSPDFLPYTMPLGSPPPLNREARTVEGVDWSGNVAVTSSSGRIQLSDINVYADVGVQSVADNGSTFSNSVYFEDGSFIGVPLTLNNGWQVGADFTQLFSDLREWRDYLSSLMGDATFQDTDFDSQPFVYVVPDSLDTNNDGIIVIDIPDDGTDFQITNLDWVIEGTGNKLVVFRVRGDANMQVDNTSIMLGQEFTEKIGASKTGVLFTKVFPNDQQSVKSVFQLSNVVMNGIGLWDLNTIDGDEQNVETEILHSDTQGCGQFISRKVLMNNVRWIHCDVMTPDQPSRGMSFCDMV